MKKSNREKPLEFLVLKEREHTSGSEQFHLVNKGINHAETALFP